MMPLQYDHFQVITKLSSFMENPSKQVEATRFYLDKQRAITGKVHRSIMPVIYHHLHVQSPSKLGGVEVTRFQMDRPISIVPVKYVGGILTVYSGSAVVGVVLRYVFILAAKNIVGI